VECETTERQRGTTLFIVTAVTEEWLEIGGSFGAEIP
jgi:hypothetical protein